MPHTDDHKDRNDPFVLGEIMLLVEPIIDLTPQVLNDWYDQLNQLLKQLSIEATNLNPSPESSSNEHIIQIIQTNSDTFPQQVTNLSVVDLENTAVNCALVHIILDSGIDISSPISEITPLMQRIDHVVINMINNLNAKLPETLKEGIKLIAAAPNWVFAGAPHSIIDGGPGGWPIPISSTPTLPDTKFDTTFADVVVDEVHRERAMRPPNGDEPDPEEPRVNVFILDTLLSPTEFTDLDTIRQQQGHALWEALAPMLDRTDLAPVGLLPPTQDMSPMFYSHKPEYKMSNHGVFIAGIIHGHCSTAKLYLMETLNVYGVGSTTSIANAINRIITTYIDLPNPHPNVQSGSTLILNCSFCVGFANLCELEALGLQLLNNSDREFYAKQTVAMLPLWAVFNDLRLKCEAKCIELRITAAAGNDGIQGRNYTPRARFPAAFPDIIGVGSCDDANNRSWYSNQADAPPPAGLLTFGGTSSLNADSKAESSGGILGIYVGDIPVPKPDHDHEHESQPDFVSNPKGWARWSGTSFATASMSGIFAAAAAQGIKIGTRQNNDFYEALQTRAVSKGLIGEKIVFGKQP